MPLTVTRTQRVQQDGIYFMGMRHIDPMLAACARPAGSGER